MTAGAALRTDLGLSAPLDAAPDLGLSAPLDAAPRDSDLLSARWPGLRGASSPALRRPMGGTEEEEEAWWGADRMLRGEEGPLPFRVIEVLRKTLEFALSGRKERDKSQHAEE